MLKNLTKENNLLIVLFLSAIAVRLLIFGLVWENFGIEGISLGDTIGYVTLSESLRNGNGFSYPDDSGDYIPQNFRPPIYPIIGAISLYLFGNFSFLIIFQIIIGSLVPPLTYLLGKEIMNNTRVALFASLILIFEPLMVFYSFYLLTDAQFLFLLMLSLLFCVKFFKSPEYPNAIYSGLFLGFATLTRVVSQYLIVYIGIFITLLFLLELPNKSYDFYKKYFVMLVVFIAVVSPWAIRNKFVFNEFSLSSNGAWAMYYDYAASLYVVDDKISFEEARDVLEERAEREYEINKDLFSGPNDRRLLARESKSVIWEKIYAVPKLQLVNAWWFFTHDNYSYHFDKFGLLPDRPPLFSPTFIFLKEGLSGLYSIFSYLKSVYFIPILGRVFWILVTLFGAYGLINSIRYGDNSKKAIIFLFGIIIYFYLISSVIGLAGEARLRIPIIPILLLFFFAGLNSVYGRFYKKI